MNNESDYVERHNKFLMPVSNKLQDFLSDLSKSIDRIDRISVRPKSIESFVTKSLKLVDGIPKYTNPLGQIQDQIGARIVVFYKSDVDKISKFILKYFRAIEEIEIVPDSESEFGYFGKHFVLFLPEDVLPDSNPPMPFFELQIKTLFQHAWSEANHDIIYKAPHQITNETKRKVAFTAAQAWGADEIFDEFHKRTKHKEK
jgi:ppGpp synthetase/RelA/SpoT-type nucleotidyltranferase